MKPTSRNDFNYRPATRMGAAGSIPERRDGLGNGDLHHKEAAEPRGDATRSSYLTQLRDELPKRLSGATHDSRPFRRRERDSSAPRDLRPAQRSPTTLLSPPDTRHSFRRERRDSSPRSLNDQPDDFSIRHAARRADQWRPRPSSPQRRADLWRPEKKSPPRRKLSPPPRYVSSSGSRDRFAAESPRSPPLAFSNMSWTNPSPQLPSTKVEIKGLRNVPTGPSRPLYSVDQSVKCQPHLFVPKSSVPINPATIQHLQGLLRPMQPTEVHMDDTGYFILFPDSIQGRVRLKMCAKKFTNSLLFGKHTLSLLPFENGRPARKLQKSNSPLDLAAGEHLHGYSNSPSQRIRLNGEPAKDHAIDPIRSHRQTDDVTSAELKTHPAHSHPPSETSNPVLAAAIDPIQHPLASALDDVSQLAASLPLSTTRSEKDDSASVLSGTTASSRSRVPKCYVCRGLGGALALTKCSTCTSRFHRQCLPSGTDLSKEGGHWQCERCKRKRIPLKRSISNMSDAASETTAGNTPSEGPVRKKPRHGIESPSEQDADGLETKQHQKPSAAQASPIAEAGPATNEGHVSALINDAPGLIATGTFSDKERNPTDAVQLAGDDPRVIPEKSFSEAHDLVEQSFGSPALAESTEAFQTSKSIGKLKIVRKKVSAPPANGANAKAVAPSNDTQAETNASQVRPPISMTSTGGQQTQYNVSGAAGKASSNQTQLQTSGLPAQNDKITPPAEERGQRHQQPVVESDTNSASPADSVLQAQAPRNRPQGKGRPTKLGIVMCSGCNKTKVPHNPSRKHLCQECKKVASAASAASNVEPPVQPPLNDTNVTKNASSTASGPARRSSADIVTNRMESKEPVPDPDPTAAPGARQDQSQGNEFDNADDDDDDESSLSSVGSIQSDSPVLVDQPLGNDNSQHTQRHAAPPTLPKQKTGTRQSQRVDAIDQYDLGNSFERPKNTYKRLMALALNAAPEHRASVSTVVQWVAQKIPNYDIKDGTWSSGLSASMKLNAGGRSGRPILKQLTVVDENGRESKVFELLPGVSDELEHWDPILQQPRSPVKLQNHSNMDAGTTATEGRPQPLDKPKIRIKLNNKLPQTQPESNHEMDVDEQLFGKKMVSMGESSDEEPLSSIKRRNQDEGHPTTAETFSSLVNQETEDAMEIDRVSSLLHAAVDLPATSASDQSKPQEDQVFELECEPDDEDDQEFLQLILKKNQDIDCSTKSLYDAWPEYDPKNQIDTTAKIAEIALRPTRKQLFKKPAFQSPLGPQPFLRVREDRSSSTHASPIKRSAKHVVSEHDATTIKTFDNLDDFFGLTDDLIPVVHERQLAFKHKNGQRRVYYKTGF